MNMLLTPAWELGWVLNCLYAKIKGLHKNTSIGELSIRPREKFHLIVPSLEIGLSYYIVQW